MAGYSASKTRVNALMSRPSTSLLPKRSLPGTRPGMTSKHRAHGIGRARRDSRLRQQPTHQRGESDLAFALEPLGGKDRAHFREGAIDVVVEDDIIVFRPVAELIAGLGHAAFDHALVVKRT